MGFNWIDLLILAIMLLFIYDGLGRTFFSEFIDLLGFLTSFFLSFALYSIPGNFLQSQFHLSRSLSLALGFIIIWPLSELIFYTLVPAIFKTFFKAQNRFPVLNSFSVIPAIIRGLIFIALILVITLTLPLRPNIKEAIQSSVLGSQLVKNAYKLESPVKAVFGGVGQDRLTFLTIKPQTDESIDLGFKTTNFHPNEKLENQMIDLVNQERVSRGIKTLTFDAKLREVARSHSADMLKRGYFAHITAEGKDIAQRADEIKVDYTIIGENLAYAPSLELAHQGLIDSEGHRANILSSDFSKIGIGIMDAGVYGLMFTQVFSN